MVKTIVKKLFGFPSWWRPLCPLWRKQFKKNNFSICQPCGALYVHTCRNNFSFYQPCGALYVHTGENSSRKKTTFIFTNHVASSMVGLRIPLLVAKQALTAMLNMMYMHFVELDNAVTHTLLFSVTKDFCINHFSKPL